MNNGKGSTYFFDNFFTHICYCHGTESKEYYKKHLCPDFLAGCWIFVTFAVCCTVGCPFVFPLNCLLHTVLFSALALGTAGAFILLYGSYPEHINSTLVYETVFCDKLQASDRPDLPSYGTIAKYKFNSVVQKGSASLIRATRSVSDLTEKIVGKVHENLNGNFSCSVT